MVATMMVCPRCWGAEGACDGCSGAGRVPDVKLTDNFTLREFVRSAQARKRGIRNDPGPGDLERIRATALHLQLLRNDVGKLVVTSGYRAPRLNEAVGGSPTSAHVKGLAGDVYPEDATLLDVMLWYTSRRNDDTVRWDQVILEPGWVHIGSKHPRSGEQRKQILVKAGPNKYLPWESAHG